MPDRFQDLGYQVTVGGLALYGDVDENGVAWGVPADVEGWDDSAGTTLQTTNRAWGAGTFSNTPFDTGKDYTVTGQFSYPDVAAYHAACGKLKQAVSAGRHVLRVNDHGVDLQATVKRSGSITFKRKHPNWCLFSFQEHADSPYRYRADGLEIGSTGLPVTQGGMTFPYEFETDFTDSRWVFAETVVSGSITIVNDGSAPSPPLIRIDGPVVNPSVEHVNTGRILSAAVTLGTGHWIEFDTATRQVLIDGSDPRQADVTRREWSDAQPGVNTWNFSADDGETSAKLTVTFREAWL